MRASPGFAIEFCYRDRRRRRIGDINDMKSAALLTLRIVTLGSLIACCPAMATSHHGHRYAARTVHHASLAHHANVAHRAGSADERASHAGITCDMVRAYVAQVGLTQAIAMAEASGITSSEKERARRCLTQKS
jgi:hypothetical protein